MKHTTLSLYECHQSGHCFPNELVTAWLRKMLYQ